MKQIPRLFYKATTQIWFYLMLPLFFLGFVLLYKPVAMTVFFDAGTEWLSFNVTMLSAILLVWLAITRNLIFILRRHLRFNWLSYTAWCIAEVVIAAFFMGLYMTLISHGVYSYFTSVGYCLGFLLMVLTYPYVIISFAVAVSYKEPPVKPESLMRFTDSSGRLRVVVAANSLLFVEADANNVTVNYLDGDRVAQYSLRNSMKSIEPLMLRHGIVRCQRSYYVNPQRIKVLRREKDGVILAELDIPRLRPVPVSPKYYDELSSMLS